ncbi:MAG: hypothetical protein IKV13_07465 [Akkermansia sp.]|nr:hypothetical protein [Akkermansia sp.]
MKKTFIALMALAGVACGESYTPLTSSTFQAKNNVTIDTVNQSISMTTSGWDKNAYATYRFADGPLTLANPNDELSFSFTIDRPTRTDETDNDKVKSLTFFSMALVGSSKATVIGHGDPTDYTSSSCALQLGFSTNVANTGKRGYLFHNHGFGEIEKVDVTESLAGGTPFDSATISGNIAWSDQEQGFILTLSSSAVTNKTLTYNLGKTYEVRDVTFSLDGPDGPSISNVTISYIPEPATATLNLLALAGLCARRRRA